MPVAPPNLPAVSAIVAHYTDANSGATAVNRWHVLSSGIAALEVFNRFTTAWEPGLIAQAPTGVRLHTLSITRLDNQSATETFSTVGTEWDGTATGEMIPNCALLIKFTTGFRGLASVGHTYAPFVAESYNENGHVLPAAISAFAPAWTGFVNTLSTQTIPLQVVSYGRADHPTLPDSPATNHTVTAVAVDPILGSQRNRLSRLRG